MGRLNRTRSLPSQSQKGVSDYVKFLHIYKEILVPGGPVNDMMLAMLFGELTTNDVDLLVALCCSTSSPCRLMPSLLLCQSTTDFPAGPFSDGQCDLKGCAPPAESLAISEDPEPMILVLESLHEKGRVLPRQSKESDPSGLTFVSRWISNNFMTAYEGEAERRKSSDVWEEPTIRQVLPPCPEPRAARQRQCSLPCLLLVSPLPCPPPSSFALSGLRSFFSPVPPSQSTEGLKAMPCVH